MFLLKFQSRIPPPIVVVLLFLLSPLTASCGGRGNSTTSQSVESTLTVTVRVQSTEAPLVGALVTAELKYEHNCSFCDDHVESRAALPTNNQGQVVIPLSSQEKSGLPMPAEVTVRCVKLGYKEGLVDDLVGKRVANCSMQRDKNYQRIIEQSNVVGSFKIKVVDKTTQKLISNPQFKFEQSVEGNIDKWVPKEHPTKITVSAENYRPQTVTVKPDEWPVTVELAPLVYQYQLKIKLYDPEGKEIKWLSEKAKVSIKFNGEDITLRDAYRFPLTVSTLKSKTRSKDEQFTIEIHYPPYKDKKVSLDLANSLWEDDQYSPGVLKATYSLTLEKPKKALVVLVNQAKAWESKRSSAWMSTSLIKILNPWWKKQKMFSYFGYGRIAAGVYPRLIHKSEHKTPANLIMGERMFNAFVEPHKLADFFLEGSDDAIWPKLYADDQPKADEWFFIIILPHNTSSPFYATVERYEAYAGEGSWQKKLDQLQANLEQYNAHLHIIEDFFKAAEETVECQVVDSTTAADSESDNETKAVDDAKSTKKLDSSTTEAGTTVNKSEPQTEEKNCVPQSTERSIIKALSGWDRISYRDIPYETFNDSVPKTVLNGLLQQIEKDAK